MPQITPTTHHHPRKPPTLLSAHPPWQAAQRSFCITDPSLPDNPIVFASQSFLETTGYTMEQVDRQPSLNGQPNTPASRQINLTLALALALALAIALALARMTGAWTQLPFSTGA